MRFYNISNFSSCTLQAIPGEMAKTSLLYAGRSEKTCLIWGNADVWLAVIVLSYWVEPCCCLSSFASRA
jgi:hypothetical protein